MKLDALFSPKNEFAAMKNEILRFREHGMAVIPYNHELVDGEINLEKLEVIAKLLRGFWENLKCIRKSRKSQGSQIFLKTDLNMQLERVVKEFDLDFWEVSKKMKPCNIS